MSNFLVYKSSAGSGKTYTLVKEYLKIALKEPGSVQGILAITFTNAAASEMKGRIIEALGDLSSLAGKSTEQRSKKAHQLLKTIATETGLSDGEVIQNAAMALSFILHNYSEFSVSTIDSFASKVIRSFAFDLHLPLNFDVELDQEQMLAQAIDLLVNRAGQKEEEALTRLLVEYIETRTDEDKNHYIETDMAQLAKSLMDEKGTLYIERLRNITLQDFGTINRKLSQSIKMFEDQIIALAKQARRLIDDEGIPDSAFYQGNKGIGAWFSNMANGNIIEKINPNTYVSDAINAQKWTSGKATNTEKDSIMQVSVQLSSLFNSIQQLAAQGLLHYKEFRLVRRNLFPMAVLCELEKVMNQMKAENSVLHISDFNRKISEIVAAEPAPFIYERIGEKYQHYMIDEFQDTSVLQWQNLLPLIDNSLATSSVNLVVGDGKQAIYRWRNGDVEQFASLPNLPSSINAKNRTHWENSLKRNYQGINLETNWRSLPHVVDFNNKFFRFASRYLPVDLAPIYADLEQKTPEEKTGGYVEINFVKSDEGGKAEYQKNTLTSIEEAINTLCVSGHKLSDITILCRANSEASMVARHLLEKGFRVISSESLLLSQSQKVNFIISILQVIGLGAQKASVTGIISFLIRSGLSKAPFHQALGEIIPAGKGFNSLETERKLELWLAKENLGFSFSMSRHYGLYDLAESILGRFFNNSKTDPYAAFFMDVVWEYSNRFVSSVTGFLEWWDENSGKYSVAVPEGVDAVQVMTIHKSKGLQFPVVICPFVDKDFSKPGKDGEWVELNKYDETAPLTIAWLSISKAMEGTTYQSLWENEMGKTLLDVLNIAYVAFTRPIEKLFILSKYPPSGKFSDKNLSGYLKLFLEENQLWNPAAPVFSFGQFAPMNTINPKERSINQEEEFFSEYISTSWKNKITIHSRQKHAKVDDAIARGTLIHAIMEKINCPEDIENILHLFLNSGSINYDDVNELSGRIKGIIGHPTLSSFYKQGVEAYNECALYGPDGHFYRVERVVFFGRKAVIIDYKTGQPNIGHKNQLLNYASLIKGMGYEIEGNYLVYVDQSLIEEVN